MCGLPFHSNYDRLLCIPHRSPAAPPASALAHVPCCHTPPGLAGAGERWPEGCWLLSSPRSSAASDTVVARVPNVGGGHWKGRPCSEADTDNTCRHRVDRQEHAARSEVQGWRIWEGSGGGGVRPPFFDSDFDWVLRCASTQLHTAVQLHPQQALSPCALLSYSPRTCGGALASRVLFVEFPPHDGQLSGIRHSVVARVPNVGGGRWKGVTMH